MIPKASRGKGFKGVVDYITNPEKAVRIEVRGLASAATAAKEMRAVAERSERVEKPVYHLSLSWAPGEKVTNDEMIEAADKVSERLGLGDHQRIYAIHADTDHPHIHIAANRVNPETGKAVKLNHDYKRASEVCRELEKERGWRPAVEPGKIGRTTTDAEIQRERRDGRLPFAHVAEEQAKEAFAQAKGWDDLADRLAKSGLRVEAQDHGARKGLVVTDGTERAKASAFGRENSRAKLEARFGETFDAYSQRTQRPERPAEAGKVQDGPFRQTHRDPQDNRARLYQDFRRETGQQRRAARYLRDKAWTKEAEQRTTERTRLRTGQRIRRRAIYAGTSRGLVRDSLLRLDDWQRRREARRLQSDQGQRWKTEKAKIGGKPPSWEEYVRENAPYDPRAAEELQRMERRSQRQQEPAQEAKRPEAEQSPAPHEERTQEARKRGLLETLREGLGDLFKPTEGAGSGRGRDSEPDPEKPAPSPSADRQTTTRRDQVDSEEFRQMTPEKQRQVIEERARDLDARPGTDERTQDQERTQTRTRTRD